MNVFSKHLFKCTGKTQLCHVHKLEQVGFLGKDSKFFYVFAVLGSVVMMKSSIDVEDDSIYHSAEGHLLSTNDFLLLIY